MLRPRSEQSASGVFSQFHTAPILFLNCRAGNDDYGLWRVFAVWQWRTALSLAVWIQPLNGLLQSRTRPRAHNLQIASPRNCFVNHSSVQIRILLAVAVLFAPLVSGQDEVLRKAPYRTPPSRTQYPFRVGSARPISGRVQVASQRWEFNFHNAPWLLVLRSFAQEFGLTLQIAAETEGLFSFYDERLLDATETMDILNDALLPTGRILIRDGERLTLVDASEAIPGNMVPFVSMNQIDSLGRNELATVAIPLKAVDSMQTVEEVGQLQSPLGQVRVLSSAGRVIVTDTGSYLRRMRDLLLGSGLAAGDQLARVYQLRHARAEDVATAISNFLSGVESAAAPEGRGGSQQVVPEMTTNSLLVRGTTEDLEMIENLITDLDRAPREVLVQALLLEVELGNVDELGIELGMQDSVLFDRSVLDNLVTITETTTAPNGTQTTNQKVLSQTAAPGFNFTNEPLGNNVAANPSRIGLQGLSSLGLSRINGDLGFGGLVLSAGSESVNVLLRALDSTFNVDILSRPSIRAVENKEALIQIGQQVPIVDGVSLTPGGSANPNITQDKAGIILRVTPRISPVGAVQLDVEAEKSSFNLTPGTGVPIFSDATNGNVIEAPIKDVTTAQTTVSIQSGHTIVLGGMITNDQTSLTRKLPWLGDMPLIGQLFRYDYNRLKRKELLVFLTPTVVENDLHSDHLRQLEMDKTQIPWEAWNMHPSLGMSPAPVLQAPATGSTDSMPLQQPAVSGAAAESTQESSAAPIQRPNLFKRISTRTRDAASVLAGRSTIASDPTRHTIDDPETFTEKEQTATQASPMPLNNSEDSSNLWSRSASRLRTARSRMASQFSRPVEAERFQTPIGRTSPVRLPRAGYADGVVSDAAENKP